MMERNIIIGDKEYFVPVAVAEEFDRLQALTPEASPSPAVPEGYVLVPKEPTKEMAEAGRHALMLVADKLETAKLTASSTIDFWQQVGHFPANSIFAAMIAAAPKAPAVQEGMREALVTAARNLLAGLQSTFKARNGREVGIEADDGEKCYIVHSDLTFALESALAAALSSPAGAWRTMESAPKDGVFLVWLPIKHLNLHFHVAAYHSNVKHVGGTFLFDLESQPKYWQPLPTPPQGEDKPHE